MRIIEASEVECSRSARVALAVIVVGLFFVFSVLVVDRLAFCFVLAAIIIATAIPTANMTIITELERKL